MIFSSYSKQFRLTHFLLILFFISFGILTSNAEEKKLKVATTFTIIADMAKNVAGTAADVVSITKAGAEIHGYQPTPRDILKVQDVDLILWNGLNLELWFEQFFNNLVDIPSVTLTDGIKPIQIVEGSYAGMPNPHAWMGLENALIYVDNIADALVRYDPRNSKIYRSNAESYKLEIISTIRPLKDKILSIPSEKRWLVSCEGAFSYLTNDFAMKELYLWPINSESHGTPLQIKKVIDIVKEKEIGVVFCESTVSQKPAQQVARETKAKYGGVLYVDSLTDINGKVPTFKELLRVNTETILKGLTK